MRAKQKLNLATHIATGLALVALCSTAVIASDDRAPVLRKDVSSATVETQMTKAEVRRVDKDSRKITLRHDPIKHLDMPAMTMVFRVKDVALIETVQRGDKVKVEVALIDGEYIVTQLEVEK